MSDRLDKSVEEAAAEAQVTQIAAVNGGVRPAGGAPGVARMPAVVGFGPVPAAFAFQPGTGKGSGPMRNPPEASGSGSSSVAMEGLQAALDGDRLGIMEKQMAAIQKTVETMASLISKDAGKRGFKRTLEDGDEPGAKRAKIGDGGESDLDSDLTIPVDLDTLTVPRIKRTQNGIKDVTATESRKVAEALDALLRFRPYETRSDGWEEAAGSEASLQEGKALVEIINRNPQFVEFCHAGHLEQLPECVRAFFQCLYQRWLVLLHMKDPELVYYMWDKAMAGAASEELSDLVAKARRELKAAKSKAVGVEAGGWRPTQKKKVGGGGGVQSVQCYACYGYGHMKNECPSPSNKTKAKPAKKAAGQADQ